MGAIPASDNVFDHVQIAEGAAPSTPASGRAIVYVKSDGLLYWKNDAGTETPAGGDVSGHTADTTDAHDASAISADTTGFDNAAGDDVQEVLGELDAAITAAGGGGGGGGGAIDCKGWVAQTYSSTNALAITIPAQAAGTRILVAVGTRSNDVTSLSCTNVTWTEVKGWNSSTTTYLSVYVGIVAGGSSGTTITVNVGGTNYVFATAVFLGDALTPTTGADASYTGSASSGRRLPLTIATTPGDLFVMAYTTSDASSPISNMETSSPSLWVPDQLQDGLCGLHLRVGMAGADHVSGWYDGGNGTAVVVGLVAIS